MSITRAYNRRTGVYYAYDVQYVWNEEAQKKLPVRKLVKYSKLNCCYFVVF